MAVLKWWTILGVNICYVMVVCVMNSTEGFLWPEGRYGLPKPNTGCPKTTLLTWQSGVLYQDCEDINPTSSKSPSYNLAGFVTNDVQREFCIKNSTTDDATRPPWPRGQYCIYQKGFTCPRGLDSGWVIWDDESENNKNEHNGTLPRGLYNNNTKIYFCCSTRGNKRQAINLPVSRPFYLIAYGSDLCQLVRGATFTREFIYYETEHYTMSSKNNYSGAHPYRATRSRYGHTIYYCYYTPKYCPPFANSTFGGYIYPPRCLQTDQNSLNDTCTVQCKPGLVPRALNSTKSTCRDDGTWDLGMLTDCIPAQTTASTQPTRSSLATKFFNDTEHSTTTTLSTTTRKEQPHPNGTTSTASPAATTTSGQLPTGARMSLSSRTIVGLICGIVVALGVIVVIFVAHCRNEKTKKSNKTSGLTVKSKSLEKLVSGSNFNLNRRRESSETLVCAHPGENEVQFFVKTDENPLYESAGPE